MVKTIKEILRNILIKTTSTVITILLVPLLISLFFYVFKFKSQPKISKKSVLHIDLQGQIIEKPLTFFEDLLSSEKEFKNKSCLWEIIEEIKYAKNDDNISAIYIKIGDLSIGWAQVEELKHALQDFKNGGKIVIAYSDHYTQHKYMIANSADTIILHPKGLIDLKGLSVVVTFYKDLLDKLEIKPEIFRVGTHKSAIEPFILTAMSKENKGQLQHLLTDIYKSFLESASIYTGLPVLRINEIAENLEISTSQKALELKFISQLGYDIDADILLKKKLNIDNTQNINYIDIYKYRSYLPKKKNKNKIALIVAEGEIINGISTVGTIGSETITKTIRKIKDDKSIKAVVLRINSPGGNAIAADTIWKELKELSKVKPIVASMSNYAASGGYYIATACNKIIAYPTTITGSIGVFGLFFDPHKLLKNKLGIVTDVAKTNSSADLGTNIGRSLTTNERNAIQYHVEDIYNTFIQRIVDGRNIKRLEVEKIASGKVWSGTMAKHYNLVDELGTLDTSITAAAKLINLNAENFDVLFYPYKSQNIWQETFSNTKTSLISLLKYNNNNHEALLNAFYSEYLMNTQGVQMKIPYIFIFN